MKARMFNKPGSMITKSGGSTSNGNKARSFLSSKGVMGGSTNPLRKAFTPADNAGTPIKGFMKK